VITTHSLQDAPAVSLPPLPVQDDFETAETLSEFNCAVCERIGIEESPSATLGLPPTVSGSAASPA
jgi:hypothetical protein